MHDVLLTLAEQPLMGYECSEIAEGLRRHDHHKHAIFYGSVASLGTKLSM
ncbi:hypothetical protein [Vibrio jasicida]|nr:hypothetical protein [Vibrio jasicida]